MLNGKSGDINQLPTVRNDMRILVQDHLFRFHDHRLGDPAMDFHQFISRRHRALRKSPPFEGRQLVPWDFTWNPAGCFVLCTATYINLNVVIEYINFPILNPLKYISCSMPYMSKHPEQMILGG